MTSVAIRSDRIHAYIIVFQQRMGRAMVHAISCRLLGVGIRARIQTSPHEMRSAQSNTGTGLFCTLLWFCPVSIIPVTLHTLYSYIVFLVYSVVGRNT